VKILHLVYSGQRRGAETFALQLSRSLSLAQAPVTQAFSSVYGFSDELLEGELPLYPLRAERRGLGHWLHIDPRAVFRLARLTRQFQPDFVLAHGADTLKYTALTRPFFPARTRVVYRNIGFASYWVSSPLKARLSGLLLRNVDAVISVGQASARDFGETYGFPPSRTVAIPNGVDARPFLESDRAATRLKTRYDLGLDPAESVAMFVGSLSDEKNPRLPVEVIARLKGQGKNWRMLFVGEGPQRAELEEQAGVLGVSNLVRFLGSRADVPALLPAADLLLLPSRTEGMPAVVIEAGLAEVPALAYAVGDVGEVVQHGVTGILVPPGNALGFQQAALDAAQDLAKLRQLGLAARQRYARAYDMTIIARQYYETLLQLQDNPERLSLTHGNASDGGR
jgi:glycosyltransferase involved in cell wall biosynthesis